MAAAPRIAKVVRGTPRAAGLVPPGSGDMAHAQDAGRANRRHGSGQTGRDGRAFETEIGGGSRQDERRAQGLPRYWQLRNNDALRRLWAVRRRETDQAHGATRRKNRVPAPGMCESVVYKSVVRGCA